MRIQHLAILVALFISACSRPPEGMVLVKGGSFQMGSNNPVIEMEGPAHQVELDDFYLDEQEVTVAQYGDFVKATGYLTDAEKDSGSFRSSGLSWDRWQGVDWRCGSDGNRLAADQLNFPVVHVSWHDAMEYAKWAGKRLPTEAEWEYAAKGGRQSRGYQYSGGNDPQMVACTGQFQASAQWSLDGPNPVRSKLPNELGIYDMSGNVWEWCSDYFALDYYKRSPSKNPSGPPAGEERVVRGGSWRSGVSACRVVQRSMRPASHRDGTLGFRCAMDGH